MEKNEKFLIKLIEDYKSIKKISNINKKRTKDYVFNLFIEIEILKINDDLEKKYKLMQIYKGKQYIWSITNSLTNDTPLDDDVINFIKDLNNLGMIYALNEIYNKEQVKKIFKQCKIKKA